MKKNIIFVGSRQDSLNIGYLQQWVGELLNDTMDYVDTMSDMAQLQNKILVLDATESNNQFDLTVKLMEKNYIIFVNTFESIETSDLGGLYNDLIRQGLINFGIIGGGPGIDEVMCLNTHEMFHVTLDDPNRLRAMEATQQIYSKNNKPFKFLFLNGRASYHRINLWKKLEKNHTLASSLHSWLSVDIGEGPDGNWVNDDQRMLQNEIPIVLLPQEYESPWCDVAGIDKIYPDNWPRYRQFRQQYWRNGWSAMHVVPAQYANTYFSVITETNGFKQPFLTEKTYKSILSGHPFIIAGTAGYYRELHKLGFETFGKFIDESFDSEPDMDQRMTMIAKQVQRLCQSDLEQFLSQCEEICLYNKQHYIDSQWARWYRTHLNLKDFFQQAIHKLQQINNL